MNTSVGASKKSWLSAAELAEMNLPGLSSKRNRVVEIASAQRWAEKYNAAGDAMARKRAGRGGGLEYHVSLLPPAAVRELARRGLLDPSLVPSEAPLGAANDDAASAAVAPGEDAGSWSWFEKQIETTKAEARRRLKAVQAVDAYVAGGLGKNAAVALAAAESGCSAATLWQWLGLLKGVAAADRLPALAPRRKGGGVELEIDPQVFQYFKSAFLTPMRRTYSGAWFYTQRWAKTQGLTVPPLKTLQRRLEKTVPREAIILAREGVKALIETVPHQTRTVADLRALSLVNIDGHTLDLWVVPPEGGEPFRPTLIAMQDVYSRKMLAWRLCDGESIFHTRLCFADLFEKWGLPERIYMDNGRAFAAKYFTGGTKTRFRGVVKEDEPWGMLPTLGITNTFATPAHGQAKPVERGFGDLVKFIAHHPMNEGAYTGNHIDNKPHNYGSKAVAWTDLKMLVDEMIGEYNAYQDRNTEMAKGRSFDEAFFESYHAHGKTVATREQLRMALLEARTHKVDRKTAVIRLHENRYHAHELYAVAGQDVTLRFDPDNLHGAPLHVYTLKGEFVCEAPIIEASGFLDAESSKAIAKKRAEIKRLGRQQLQAEDLLSAAEVAARQPRATTPTEQPESPKVLRTGRRGGNAAVARLAASAVAVQQHDRVSFNERFTAAVSGLEAVEARRNFTILDGGLSPQSEPERPKK